MSGARHGIRIAHWLAAGVGFVAGGYATYAGLTWRHYGRTEPAGPEERDSWLDRFIPEYDVAERHHTRVAAPADAVLAAAAEIDLQESALIRAVFRARELVLGAERDNGARPKGLLADVTSLGWRVLAEDPGREIVLGAVTQPWMANVVFRGLPPDDFIAFREPDYVKIAWTLRADAVAPDESIFRTETRVATTDRGAREKFRFYWACFSPGIILIRRIMLGLLKKRFASPTIEGR